MLEVKVEIDDEVINFTLPTGWEDVSIGEFAKLFSVPRDNQPLLEQAVDAISLLGGVDKDIIYQLPYEEFTKLAEAMEFINTEMIPEDLTEGIDIDGETYYFKKDFSKFTMGEIISIETLLSQSNNNLFLVMDKLLCVFLRKKTDKGNLESFKGEFLDRAPTFGRLPVSRVFNIFNFFSDGGFILQNNTNQSLKNPPKQKTKRKIGSTK